MKADTLKKQTCFSLSVYTLRFLSLCLSLLHCLGWQLLDCFTSRSPWRWLLRGEKPGSHPIPSDCNSLYVCQRVPRRSILFRCAAAAWIRGGRPNTAGRGFQPNVEKSRKQGPLFKGEWTTWEDQFDILQGSGLGYIESATSFLWKPSFGQLTQAVYSWRTSRPKRFELPRNLKTVTGRWGRTFHFNG